MDQNRSVRIAIADEQALFRKGLSCLISSFKEFRTIVEASSGQELIRELSGRRIQPDLCILSATFPVAEVHSAIQKIKKKWPKMKVLLLTSGYNKYNIDLFLGYGADGLLTRSCTQAELKLALLTVAQGHKYMEEPLKLLLKPVPATKGKRYRKRSLTARQMQFLSFCMTELSYFEIAKQMGKSQRTIDGYRETLFRNLNITTRTGLTLFAVAAGIEKQVK